MSESTSIDGFDDDLFKVFHKTFLDVVDYLEGEVNALVTQKCHNLTRNCNPKKKCFNPEVVTLGGQCASV